MSNLSRAQGCILGQLAGDSLGSLVEFKSSEQIRSLYPHGIKDLADGGTWDTLAGQPTDDSELALVLARTIIEQGGYDAKKVLVSYKNWLHSMPFDCGNTTAAGLGGNPDHNSQANGAMMRISPLGIFGAGKERTALSEWAKSDALMTHPNPVCVQANILYVTAIATAIESENSPELIYKTVLQCALDMQVVPVLIQVIEQAEKEPPKDYVRCQGWVLTALQNALWQLLHAESAETGIIDTVMRGGDTDTNAAICGALLGAVYGINSIPTRWVDKVLSCRPESGKTTVYRPRPAMYWPIDALELAEALLK